MKKSILILTGAFSLMALTGVHAVERTGREFGELIKEMDQELNKAKQAVEVLEDKRAKMNVSRPGKKILEERRTALRQLESETDKLDNAKSRQDKKILEKNVEKRVLEVAKLSADFLEAKKTDLMTQDKQLEVIENALSSVVMKMDKLQRLAKEKMSDGSGDMSAAQAKLKARRNLKKIAGMVEMLAAKNGKGQHWRSVRQTIMLHNQMLKNTSINNSQVLQMLEKQKQVYEQVLAQLSIVREGLQAEKELLAQIALGEIARSLLRKAAGLLLGNQSIEEIGKSAIVKAEVRQQEILAFLQQDKNYSGGNYGDVKDGYSDDLPSGYSDFLEEKID